MTTKAEQLPLCCVQGTRLGSKVQPSTGLEQRKVLPRLAASRRKRPVPMLTGNGNHQGIPIPIPNLKTVFTSCERHVIKSYV